MTISAIWRMLIPGAALVLVVGVAGCGPKPVEPAPTGDELVEQARQHYVEYRTITNDVQALIFAGPWESDIGGYGMQPTDLGCEDDEYSFDFTRTTRVPAEQHSEMAARVQQYLTDAGYEIEGTEMGSGKAQSLDVKVNTQPPFAQLMVTFIANDAVLVTAKTACWPGDSYELSDLISGDVNLSAGYLPSQESPSDPLFFGITPGEPKFANTPTSAPAE